jgi:hypothetical protein
MSIHRQQQWRQGQPEEKQAAAVAKASGRVGEGEEQMWKSY